MSEKTLAMATETIQDRTSPAAAPDTFLGPGQEFPRDVAELDTVALQVLHSRICRQLDREHLDPAGPHPETLDRYQELIAELDVRDENRQ